jgi:hypothetical protein
LITLLSDLDRRIETLCQPGCTPDAPKAARSDAMPADDIETAYRLYCEEISQAWKTPR